MTVQPIGRGLQRAPLTLTDAQGSRWTVHTGDAGQYRFLGLTPGSYQIEIAVPQSYMVEGDAAQSFEIEGDGHPTQDFTVSVIYPAGLADSVTSLSELPAPDGLEQPADATWTPIDPYEPAHLAMLAQVAEHSTCGVPWQVLAAIARVESNFGRNMSTSWAGAVGYGQFLPTTWDIYGRGGDPYDYRDTLPAMERLLCSKDAAQDLRQALYAYNPANWYVDMVLAVARRFDAISPDGPSRAILDTPLRFTFQESERPLRYAPGRDTARQQRVAGTADGTLRWLGVPFVPRARTDKDLPSAISMVAAVWQSHAPAAAPPASGPAAVQSVEALAAWGARAGLAALDDRDGSGAMRGWTLDMVRWHLQQGHPVILDVAEPMLPGHAADVTPPTTPRLQPIVLTGWAPGGFIYNDPSFASTLGYGLEVGEDDLLAAWSAEPAHHRAVALAQPGQGDATPRSLASLERIVAVLRPDVDERPRVPPLPEGTETLRLLPTPDPLAVVEDITTDRALPAPTPAAAVVAPAAVEVGPRPPPEPAEPLFWRLSTGMALLGFWARRLIHTR